MEKASFEEWRPVVGWEGYYEVSNLGRVRSLPRQMHNYVKQGRVLKVHDNGHSYLDVGLHAPNRVDKHAYVHILVATAFIPNPDNLREVNHKDFNKQNNCVDNLEWVSSRDNKLHYMRSKRAKAKMNERTEKQHSKWVQRILDNKNQIIELYKQGNTIKYIAKTMNLGRDFVTEVLDIYELR
jgi:hypothetical protein